MSKQSSVCLRLLYLVLFILVQACMHFLCFWAQLQPLSIGDQCQQRLLHGVDSVSQLPWHSLIQDLQCTQVSKHSDPSRRSW